MNDESTVNTPALHSGKTTNLVLDGESIQSMERLANLMASGKCGIPKHFQNSPSDCLQLVMYAVQWQVNPFSIATQSFVQPNGSLGFQSQLINAVAVNSGIFQEEPEYEFLGDWSKVQGKVIEKKSEKNGGKYYVQGWTPKDEQGLGVKITATMKNGKPRSMVIMMTQAYPRFSTQWATDPQQQISYLALRKFVRRYAPGVLMGIYSEDERVYDDEGPKERDITPEPQAQPEAEPGKPGYTQEQYDQNAQGWKDKIAAKKTSAVVLCNKIKSKYELPEELEEKIMELASEAAQEPAELEGEIIDANS